MIKLSFKIFSSIGDYFREIGEFFFALLEYFGYKLEKFLVLIPKLILNNLDFYRKLKFKTTGLLILSRGKLGFRFRYIFILFLIIGVLSVGGIFQDKVVVSSSTGKKEFVNKSTVFATRASAATEQSENRILDKPIEYIAQPGDDVTSIGKQFGISFESVKYANNLVSNNVKPGTKLIIPPVDGTVHVVKKGETINSLAKYFKVPVQLIVDYNYIDAPYELTEGQYITIPNAENPNQEKFYAGTQVLYTTSAYGIVSAQKFDGGGSGKFIWPFSGLVTQEFSTKHPGLDIAKPTGDVVSSDKGKVTRAGWWQGGYGNAVQIDHGNGFITTYAHMSSIAVSVGDMVNKGEKIGVVGSTGRSTGPHVHFTIQADGKYVNPLNYMPK